MQSHRTPNKHVRNIYTNVVHVMKLKSISLVKSNGVLQQKYNQLNITAASISFKETIYIFVYTAKVWR